MQYGKKAFRSLLARLMVFSLIISSVLLNPGTIANAAVKEPAISKTLDITVGGEYSFKVSNSVKNSSYKWTSGNKKVATITNKGVVTGIKKGTVDIICTVKTPESEYYLVSKVTVRDPADTVKIKNKIRALNLGQKYDLNRTLAPADSNDKVIWSSSNTSIAKPDSLGRIKALKTGKVKITAKTLSGQTDSVTINVVDRDGTVTNQAELNKLLNSGAGKITLKSTQDLNITIPEGSYKKQILVVDAPNSDITNQGTFKAVELRQIKANTWYEQAIGNIINVSAPSARVIIDEVASAFIHVNSGTENFSLVNNGAVNGLLIDTAANIQISGNSLVPIPVNANNAGAMLTSSIPLTLTCTERINLVILPGAEATTIQVASEDLIPVITGSSSLRVMIGSGEDARSVVVAPTVNTGSPQGTSGGSASNPDNPSNPNDPDNPNQPETPVGASISGRVTVVTGSSIDLVVDGSVVTGSAISTEPLPGVNVRILKYDGDAASAIDSIFNNPNTRLSCTNGEGYYSVDNLDPGNYIVVLAKTDYKILVQLATVVENSPSIVNGSLIKLESGEGTTDGTATGKIIDSLTGNAVDEALEFTLEVYENFNDTTQQVTTQVVSGAAFSIRLPEGYYTIKLIDKREAAYGITYSATTRNLIVLGGTAFTDQDVVMATLKEAGQASFVLTWDEFPRDLDSHLIGPVEGNLNYHIYFANKTYPAGISDIELLDLRLDVDDIDSYGPETTSIYKPVQGGIYTYYIYNYSGNYGGTLVNSGAKVVVTTMTGTYTFEAPAGGEQRSWVVCTFNSATSEITPINRLVDGDYIIDYMNQVNNR